MAGSADTAYDRGQRPWPTSPPGPWWNNVNDRVEYQRVFNQGGLQEKRIAQAMLSQDPLTPRTEIQRNMTTRKFPPRFGYDTDELTITDVLTGDFNDNASHVNDSAWNDFSGSNGETNSTVRPSGNVWW